ncbi:MAG TPA: type II secretion system protein [Patescibacteria group bacterium]|nr:type II secretion system protein [Patescibacteria group bacterium]
MKMSPIFSGGRNEQGFTLLEILLVVAAIAILAGIVILALNPSKQIAETENAQRNVDVNTILNAVYQYAIDNNGTLPSAIPTSTTCATTATNEICKTGGTCTNLVDLSVLTTNETYLVSLPTDPDGVTTNGAGYHIAKSSNGRVTVCAPDAEQGATISVKR